MFNLYHNSPWLQLTLWSVWGFIPPFIILILILDLALRGFALWRAARANQQWWFISLLALNTMGILPAVYLFLIEPRRREQAAEPPATKVAPKKKPKPRQLAAKK